MGNRKGLGVMAVLVLVAAAGLTACGQKTAVAQEQIKVSRGDIVQSVNADGELSLVQQRKLTFGVNGKIEEVKVMEGARVSQGQLLARLEAASLERAVKTAELGIKSAEADRQQAEAGLKAAQADLKQAELAVKTAEADREQADYAIQTAEASRAQAEYGVKTAEADKELKADSLRKISYPYTYATFTVDVPAAIAAIYSAQLSLNQAAADLQPGATNYGEALTKFNNAQNNLTAALQQLGKGANLDTLVTSANQTAEGRTTTIPSWVTTDIWTLRAAQLQVDKAQLALDTAKATLNAARLAVDTARSNALKGQLGTEVAKAALDKARAAELGAEATLSKARLGVDRARYDLDTANETLAKAAITAPFDGIIARVNVKAGDVLTPLDYTRTIFELIDPRHMEFTIKVDEIDIPGVELGQEAAISVDALPDLKLKGKVIFVSPLPVVEGGVVQYEVKIGFDVPGASALKTGMSASATIVVDQHKNALIVPNRAITIGKGGKPTVKLVVDGQVQEKAVQTGLSNSQDTEIVSGLSEGDTVIVERPAKSGSALFGG